MPRKKRPTDAVLRELRAYGLAYPGAHTKSPWPGHLDLAVNDKTFAYLSVDGEPFGISCKLPRSAAVALMLPFTSPTPYGLGKSGWVSASPPEGEQVPVDMFKEWIDESYRAQAPKKLVAQLDGAGGAGAGAASTGGARPATAGRRAAPGRRAASGGRAAPARKAAPRPRVSGKRSGARRTTTR